MSDLDVEAQKANVEANKAAEAVSPLETEEVQMAAGHYGHMAKMIRGYSRNMGGKGLARVMIALADFPFAESYPKFRSDAEQKLFTFMLSIQSAKAKMAEAFKADLGEIQSKAIDGIVEETLTNLKGDKDGSNKMD